MKSTDYISWDEYFMGVALLSAHRSKDPNTPYGCNDDVYPWERDGDFLNTKYPYVVHAEPNAILNSTSSLEGATLYVSLFPCHECMKLIIQSGIKEIVYLSDKYSGTPSDLASKKMADSAGLKYRKMKNMNIRIENE